MRAFPSTDALRLSDEEMIARSIRMNPGRPVDASTGTLNDPFQEAQHRYSGPAWNQFFGGLQKQQEDAQFDGKRFRVGLAGFGNSVSKGESSPSINGLKKASR